jgi:hypothetical protein
MATLAQFGGHAGLGGGLDVDVAAERAAGEDARRFDTTAQFGAQSSRQLVELVQLQPPGKADEAASAPLDGAGASVSEGVGAGVSICTQSCGLSRALVAQNAALQSQLERVLSATRDAELEDFVANAGVLAGPGKGSPGEDAALSAANAALLSQIAALGTKIKTLKAASSTPPTVTLESDFEIEDVCAQESMRHYKLPYAPGCVGFKVVLRAIEGDPDLFVCQRSKQPDKLHHTWRSMSEGVDSVIVPPGAPLFKPTHVYVGISGVTRSHFKLRATWTEASKSDDAEGGSVRRLKKAAAVRVADKIDVLRAAARTTATATARASTVPRRPEGDPGSSCSNNRRSNGHNNNQPRRGGRHLSVINSLFKELAETARRSESAVPGGKVAWRGVGKFVLPGAANGPLSGPPTYVSSSGAAGAARKPRGLSSRVTEALASARSPRAHAPQEDTSLWHELQQCYGATARMQRALDRSIARATQITELGGLALEAPVRTKDPKTQRELLRAALEQQQLQQQQQQQQQEKEPQEELRKHLHHQFYKASPRTVGITDDEMRLEREVVTANKHFQ